MVYSPTLYEENREDGQTKSLSARENKGREFGNSTKKGKTQGTLLCSVVNSLVLKIRILQYLPQNFHIILRSICVC